ncbi:MAG: MBL fold metallo-hydrolase [Verrucomicrobiaceae bacterium]|nr:MBL fold metallo-hydrolase [Verrucomicrobiaceae bacterium]
MPEADLWLDPPFAAEHAFVSHAHSDHVGRHRHVYCTALTEAIMRERYRIGKKTVFHSLPLRTPTPWGDWEMNLLPAGHIAGSAMLHLTRKTDGSTLLYTGDYKLSQGLSAERCELRCADVLIMETTFGRPHYCFPPRQTVIDQIRTFASQTLSQQKIPLLLGYSLGKAQEILAALSGLDVPVMAHESVIKMTQIIAPHMGPLPTLLPFDAAQATGHVLVFPPHVSRTTKLQSLPTRKAMVTGWALDARAKYQYRVDELIPLSDHADYPELLETVETVKPRRTYLVHGFVQEFGADLRARGWDARSLGREDQLELDIFTRR